jgi:hypothetical protein
MSGINPCKDKLAIAVDALRAIAYPLQAIYENCPEGQKIDPGMALHITSSATYLSGLARDALRMIEHDQRTQTAHPRHDR